MKSYELHSFHVPVMGIGYTADSAIRISKYGLSSVISLVDDQLLEKIGNHYSSKFKKAYEIISEKNIHKRSIRITKYLNLVNEIVNEQFDNLIKTAQNANSEFSKLLNLLPEASPFKSDYLKLIETENDDDTIQNWIRSAIKPGSIDVNIMTKQDKINYDPTTKEALPIEFNDAHSALKGFADSDLEGDIVLSAGMNNKLYSYMEKFEDFFPNENGIIKKRIILKVSDYRSALIQSKFLAKKGLWVSEFRIESGLNCGGHAFATDGLLAGVILEEFKNNRAKLDEGTKKIITKAFDQKEMNVDVDKLEFKVVYQSGVGTADEHEMLLDQYNLDKIGWATPFLLVPEVTAIDDDTLNLVADAKEDDFYLSGASPLGVLFNNIKGNSRDKLRDDLIKKEKPGSPCPKRYLALDPEFGDQTICASSRKYVKQKLEQLDQKLNSKLITEIEYAKQKSKVEECSCICVGLGVSALKELGIKRTYEGEEISICPGPNAAYFNRKYTLQEMVDHIYGRINLVDRDVRPNLFIKELECYLKYLDDIILSDFDESDIKAQKKLEKFVTNLKSGIEYYKTLIEQLKGKYDLVASEIERDLNRLSIQLDEKLA